MVKARPDVRWLSETLSGAGGASATQSDLVQLARGLRRTELDPGAVLYGGATRPPGVWIIESGCVELSEGSGNGRSVVGTLKSGDVAGDVYLLLDVPPAITARCSERTMCWFLPARHFRRLLASYPSLALAWLCNLATRVEQSRARVTVVLGRTLAQRLAGLLLEEAADATLRLPQRSLAQMVGAQRTSVNKALKDLEAAGLVSVGYGTVALTDAEGLRAVAAGSAPEDTVDEETGSVDGRAPAAFDAGTRVASAS